jgi:oxalate decarboxylase
LPTFRFALEDSPAREMPGGTAREATIKQLPISTGLAGVSMKLKPGAIRELHWHAIAAEWAYVIRGNVRTTIVGPGGTCETNDFVAGDVWYFPRGHGHAIACLGDEECHFLLIFDNGAFSEFGTFSSTDWVGHIDAEVLARCLGVSAADLKVLAHEELYIVQGRHHRGRQSPAVSNGA